MADISTDEPLTYFDYNSMQEIGFRTSGGGTSPHGGLAADVILKRGTNTLTGSAGIAYSDSGLQGDVANPLTMSGFPFEGRTLDEALDVYGEVSGPIVADRAWYWVGLSRSTFDAFLPGPGGTELTNPASLENATAKVHGRVGERTSYKVFATWGDKLEADPIVPSRAPETVWRQSSGVPIVSAEVGRQFENALDLSFQFSHVGGGFDVRPRAAADQMRWDSQRVWQDTYLSYVRDLPVDQVAARGSWFHEMDALAHDFKFGFKYKEAELESLTRYGQADTAAVEWLSQAWLYRSGEPRVETETVSAWVGDTIVFDRWTFLVGADYLRQTGKQGTSSARANPTCPACLPALQFGGADPGFVWDDVLPRLGLTYLFDTPSRMLVRASAGRYADRLSASVVGFNHPMRTAEIDYPWSDSNGDDLVQLSEIATGSPVFASNVDPFNPGVVPAPVDFIDRKLEAPRIDEALVGFELEARPGLSIAMHFTRREKDRTLWNPLIDLTSVTPGSGFVGEFELIPRSHWEPVSSVSGTIRCAAPNGPCPLPQEGEPYTVEAWALDASGVSLTNFFRPEVLTNRPDYTEVFESFTIRVRKRMSHRWSFDGSFAVQDWSRRVGPRGFQNPSSSVDDPLVDGSKIGIGGGVESTADFSDVFYGSAGWSYALDSRVQLPLRMSLHVHLNGREGYVLPLYDRVTAVHADGFRSFENLLVASADDTRLEDVHLMNAGFSYRQPFAHGSFLDLSVDVFNVLDDDTVLQMGRRIDSASSGQIREIVGPRTIRVGARWVFP